MLGNLSIRQIERRMGIEFPTELKEILSKYHQSNVSIPIAEGFWHCFDLPFTMVCGGKDLSQLVFDHLSPMQDIISTPLHIAVTTVKKGYEKEARRG